MKAPRALVAIKLLHTAVWCVMNVAIFHLLHAVVTDRLDRWAWISLALIGAESAVLLFFKMTCPLTLVAQRYTDDRPSNFDIYLPLWLARYNKLIYGILLAGILCGLAWRLASH